MTTKHTECYNCEAVFKIKHDLDAHYYKVEFCPFCGSGLDDEESFEQDDIEE